MCEHPMYHTSHIHISPHQTSHIHMFAHHTSQAERREHKEEVLGPSSWAGWHSHHITHHHISPDIRHHISPYHTSQAERREHKEEVLGPSLGPDGILTTSHIITSHHISHHKPKGRKSTSFIVKTLFKSIPEERKVRELPRKMNIEEVEEPKKYENYHAKPVSDPFKSIAEHRKVR